MNGPVLDTDVISRIIKGKDREFAQLAEQLLERHARLTISALTQIEIAHGLRMVTKPMQSRRFDELLPSMEVLAFDSKVANIAADISATLSIARQDIGAIDPLIAATAIANGRELCSGNLRHFQRVVEMGFPLQLRDWRNLNAP